MNQTDSVGELTRGKEVEKHDLARRMGIRADREAPSAATMRSRSTSRSCHERDPRRTPERALLAPLAALGLECEELGDVAVGERRYEEKLVRVEESHAGRGTIGPVWVVRKLHADAQVAAAAPCTIDFDEHLAARRRSNVNEDAVFGAIRAWIDRGRGLDEEFDRDPAGRDPAVSSIDVQTIAIPDRAVMDHEAAIAPPRAATQMVQIPAFVVDDRRHTSPPQS